MDFKVVDKARALVRQHADKRTGDVPSWVAYDKLVHEQLRDAYNLKVKMPKEYYYAYLREKGLSDADARVRMGLDPGDQQAGASKKSFWKFWE